MSSKRITYLLFPVVAAIWGYAIYKYFFYSPEEETLPASTVTQAGDSLLQTVPQFDTFTLLADYPDPFYAGGASLRHHSASQQTSKQPSEPQPSIRSERPAMPVTAPAARDHLAYTYCGLVQQTGTVRQTGILRVHAKSYFVQPGDHAAGLTVVAIYPDSMTARTDEGLFTLKRK